MSDHSIRLRFVDWLKGVGNHVTEKLVEKLCGPEVHPQATCYVHDTLIFASVNYPGAKGQAYDAAPVSGLKDQVYELGDLAVIANVQPLVTNRELSPGSYDHLLSHQTSPLGKNLSLIANEGEVESTPTDMAVAS